MTTLPTVASMTMSCNKEQNTFIVSEYVEGTQYCGAGYLRSTGTFTFKTRHRYSVEFDFTNWSQIAVGNILSVAFAIHVEGTDLDYAPYPQGEYDKEVSWDGEKLGRVNYSELRRKPG